MAVFKHSLADSLSTSVLFIYTPPFRGTVSESKVSPHAIVKARMQFCAQCPEAEKHAPLQQTSAVSSANSCRLDPNQQHPLVRLRLNTVISVFTNASKLLPLDDSGEFAEPAG